MAVHLQDYGYSGDFLFLFFAVGGFLPAVSLMGLDDRSVCMRWRVREPRQMLILKYSSGILP